MLAERYNLSEATEDFLKSQSYEESLPDYENEEEGIFRIPIV